MTDRVKKKKKIKALLDIFVLILKPFYDLLSWGEAGRRLC